MTALRPKLSDNFDIASVIYIGILIYIIIRVCLLLGIRISRDAIGHRGYTRNAQLTVYLQGSYKPLRVFFRHFKPCRSFTRDVSETIKCAVRAARVETTGQHMITVRGESF